MAKLKTPRLTYLPASDSNENEDAQPCVVSVTGMKPFRVVPVANLIRHDCTMCVGVGDGGSVPCNFLPDCSTAVYVRATPANKLKHIEWLLNKD